MRPGSNIWAVALITVNQVNITIKMQSVSRQNISVKYAIIILLYILVLIIAGSAGLCFGSEKINIGSSIREIISGDVVSVDARILLHQRLPRVLMAVIAGGCLAVVGAVFQTILRNPLAAPYTLGISGSSSVGAVLAISVPVLTTANIFGFGLIQLFALSGGLFSAVFIYFLAKRSGGMSMNMLLLAGVAISIISASCVMLIRYISSPYLLVSMDRWIMGGLDVAGMKDILPLMPFILPGLGILFVQSLSLNHLVLGDQMAMGHGISVDKVQKWCFAGGSITTAAVISQTGPIAFVGLIIPHITKKISGNDHRLMLPASMLGGAAFLVLCDTLARTIVAPAQMPVGIITAAIGGIFFIILLCRN